LGFHSGDPLTDVLGHDVTHLHWPKEWQQVPADLPQVLASHTGLELVVRQPLVKHVRLEGLSPPAGVTALTSSDGCLSRLPGIIGLLLAAEAAGRPLLASDVPVVGRVSRLAVTADSLAGKSHDHTTFDHLTAI
jgi:hypothetical protein